MDGLTYNQTRLGLFSSLGLGTLYTHRNNKVMYPVFEVASLLQHLLVPMDSDILCPYLPSILGGDGAFSSDLAFLDRVYSCKPSHNVYTGLIEGNELSFEVYHRIRESLVQSF